MDELTDIWDDNQRQKTMDHVLQGIDGRTKEWMYNECHKDLNCVSAGTLEQP